MTKTILLSAFVGALALAGAQSAFAADWIPAGAAAPALNSKVQAPAPAQVVSNDTTPATTQVASWVPAGVAAADPTKQVAVASSR